MSLVLIEIRPQRIIAFTQYSCSTTGSSLNAIARYYIAKKKKMNLNNKDNKISENVQTLTDSNYQVIFNDVCY